MKAAAFRYACPPSVAQVCALLAAGGGMAKPIAGGQSFGPMLNLRLAQPDSVVDLAALAALREVLDEGESIFIGAGVTHAAIEDGKIADPSGGLMPYVAANIAYRAVRNRGTLGGSLAHADPAADWVSTMLLLDAVYVIDGPSGTSGASAANPGRREVGSGDFMQAAFTTALREDEILAGVRIRKCSGTFSKNGSQSGSHGITRGTRFGYFKFCRKSGEFAEAIGAVLIDPARGVRRAVIGATASAPHLVRDVDAVLAGDAAAMVAEVRAAGCDEPYEFQMHLTALRRAVAMATAATANPP